MFIHHDEDYYERRKPQPDLGPFKNLLRFIWNKEKRAFLDRSTKEWGEVCIFYLLFFGVLFAVFGFQMWITISYVAFGDKPYFQYYRAKFLPALGRGKRHWLSVDFGSPGIGLHPNILMSSQSPFILVNDSQEVNPNNKFVDAVDNLLKEYKQDEKHYDSSCTEGKKKSQFSREPCFFDVKKLGKCSERPYGYNESKPCVFLKFNKRFDWIPNYYDKFSELPEEMPEFLQNLIKSSENVS